MGQRTPVCEERKMETYPERRKGSVGLGNVVVDQAQSKRTHGNMRLKNGGPLWPCSLTKVWSLPQPATSGGFFDR